VRRFVPITFVALLLVASGTAAFAQDDDAVLRPAEPDFTLVALPTGLPLPRFKSAFRVTHRFLRPLEQGDFGDLAGDAFGLDNGAQIGLEYRFGIIRNGQIGVNRTSDKTVEFFAQYAALRQRGAMPVAISGLAAVDGTDNFKGDSKSPVLGAIVSRTFGTVAALYVEPMWINNSNPLPKELVEHNDTFAVGVGARLQVRNTLYLVGEITPRAAGYRPGRDQGSFGIEKRVGGHVFQLNFSNGVGTLFSQLARGGDSPSAWHFGFNITRKFF
jgi:hypothetical protein